MRLYKSSVLGLSIEYPADWQKGAVAICGTGRIGKTDEELLHWPIYPVRFHAPQGDAHLTVTLYRKFEGDLGKVLAWHSQGSPEQRVSDFQFAGGFHGKRLVKRYEPPQGDTTPERISVTYIVAARGRRVELSGSCAAKDFAARRPTFERMAHSLRLFPPQLDLPRPGTTKAGRAAGFSFEYPGEWEWKHLWDDEEAAMPEGVHLVAPEDSRRARRELRACITISRRPKETESLDECMGTMRKAMKGTDGTRLLFRPFENKQGRGGIAVEYACGLRTPYSLTMMIYVFETADGDWVTVHGYCPTSRFEEFAPVFERVANNLKID